MTDPAAPVAGPLTGRGILLVEDVYLLADDIARALAGQGADVVGPVASVPQALALVACERLDAAILDVNVAGTASFPVADALQARAIPFIFATGFDDWALPSEWQHVTRIGKPFPGAHVAGVVAALLRPIASPDPSIKVSS